MTHAVTPVVFATIEKVTQVGTEMVFHLKDIEDHPGQTATINIDIESKDPINISRLWTALGACGIEVKTSDEGATLPGGLASFDGKRVRVCRTEGEDGTGVWGRRWDFAQLSKVAVKTGLLKGSVKGKFNRFMRRK